MGIFMDANCDPLIADLFLYCYEGALMSSIYKSKLFGIIDMFNDVSRYLDDVLFQHR